MEEQYITLETAKLAKEKGLDVKLLSLYYFCPDQLMWKLSTTPAIKSNWNNKDSYSAPTQSLLQKWLREKHNIQVYCYSMTKKNDVYGDYVCCVNGKEINDARDEEFQTYEECLEVGLQYALEELI